MADINGLTEDLAIIQKLGDNPNTDDGLSAAELKAKFDAAPLAIKKYINEILVPAVNSSVKRDGTTPMTGDLQMGNHRVKDVAAPEEDGDAVNLGYANQNYRHSNWMPNANEVGAAPASHDHNHIVLAGVNSDWRNAPNGNSLWMYEGADTTALNLPFPHCFVHVMKEGGRGVAIAYKWDFGVCQVCRNTLHDTWRGWVAEPDGKISFDILWRSADPTIGFPNQVIWMNLVPYEMILINYTLAGNLKKYKTGIYKVQGDNVMSGYYAVTSSGLLQVCERKFSCSNREAIIFDDAMVKTADTSAEHRNDNACIPYEIYGIKGVPV